MLGARNTFSREKVSSEIRFDGSLIVDRAKTRREGIPNSGASLPKSMRCESNVDKRKGEKN